MLNQRPIASYLFLIYIIFLTQGIFLLKFISFPILFFLGGIIKIEKKNYATFFYIFMFAIGLCMIIYNLGIGNIGLKGSVVGVFAIFFWAFGLINLLFISSWIRKSTLQEINWVIDNFFIFNSILCFFQYGLLMIKYRSINPFTSELGTSAGDFIIGFFSNSSVNMIICAFFFSYYMFIKLNRRNAFIAILCLLLTTYMSGILIFLITIVIYIFFIRKTTLTKRVIYLSSILFSLFLFVIISYNNVEYAIGIFSLIFEVNPPRKIVAFQETYELLSSNWLHFFVGLGPGMFSSRAAFIADGEYVSWYPSVLAWKSSLFANNHYLLWNPEVLSIDYNDGTANQPFSLYNQLLGEYGIIGFISFLALYIRHFYTKSLNKNVTILFIMFMFGFMVLDYWFEYLSVIVFFEFFCCILIKYKISSNEKNTLYGAIPTPC